MSLVRLAAALSLLAAPLSPALRAQGGGAAPRPAASAASAASAVPAVPPAVHVIGTGGTIGSAGDYWGGNPTRVAIAELVRIPGAERVASLSTEQLWNVASSAIGPTRWLELSRRVATLFRERPELAGIVVTHGTDT